MDIKEAIDLHVHVGPEIVPRKFTVEELVKEEAGKIAAIAAKSHTIPTVPLVKSIGEGAGLRLIGSVTLNNFVGGINADAVYVSAELMKGPIIVWFPTIHARNHIDKMKESVSDYEFPLEWFPESQRLEIKPRLRRSNQIKGIKVTREKGKITEEAKEVLQVIRDYDLILATGHVSWEEAKLLVEAALNMGIKRIILTHPIYQHIHMPVERQKELTENESVFVEHSYSMFLIDKIPIGKIAQQIKEVGPEHCILTSDLGQADKPNPSDALRKFSEELLAEGISVNGLERMLTNNPRYLISTDRG